MRRTLVQCPNQPARDLVVRVRAVAVAFARRGALPGLRERAFEPDGRAKVRFPRCCAGVRQRLLVLLAVGLWVDLHQLELTPLMPLLGRDFEDLAEVNGRLYSNKAPGGALVGLPAYAVARVFVGPPSPRNMRVTLSGVQDASRLVGDQLAV